MIKNYEIEILRRMMSKELISMNYKSIQKVASAIKWDDIAREFKVNKSFKAVIKGLRNKGYIDDHGKSLHVASLTKKGVKFVLGIED